MYIFVLNYDPNRLSSRLVYFGSLQQLKRSFLLFLSYNKKYIFDQFYYYYCFCVSKPCYNMYRCALIFLLLQRYLQKGLTKGTLYGIILFKLNTFLVMFSRVPSIDSTCFPRTWGLQGIVFFLLSTDSTYSHVPEDKGGMIFYRQDFFGTCFTYKLMYYNLYHVSNFMQN